MIQVVFNLVCVFFAVTAVMRAWFSGAIFKPVQDYCFSRLAKTSEPNTDFLGVWLLQRMPDIFIDGISCVLCLSHHIPYILLSLFFVPSLFVKHPYDYIIMIPIYSLAITELFSLWDKYVNPVDGYYDTI